MKARLHAWESGLDEIYTAAFAERTGLPLREHLVAEGIEP